MCSRETYTSRRKIKPGSRRVGNECENFIFLFFLLFRTRDNLPGPLGTQFTLKKMIFTFETSRFIVRTYVIRDFNWAREAINYYRRPACTQQSRDLQIRFSREINFRSVQRRRCAGRIIKKPLACRGISCWPIVFSRGTFLYTGRHPLTVYCRAVTVARTPVPIKNY